MDPLSEAYYDTSPYAYALNNPLKYIDPSETDIIYVFEDGTEYDRMEAEGDDVIIKGISKEPVVTWWYYKWYNKYYDDGIPEDHELLDYGSMIPGVLGSAASLMNAGLYAYEGNYSSATSNGFSAIPFGKVLKKGSKLLKFGSNVTKGVGNIAKNTSKMSSDDIGKFLGAGKNWHGTTAKKDYLKQFSKQLKGDTNADFYIDKTTKEVFFKK